MYYVPNLGAALNKHSEDEQAHFVAEPGWHELPNLSYAELGPIVYIGREKRIKTPFEETMTLDRRPEGACRKVGAGRVGAGRRPVHRGEGAPASRSGQGPGFGLIPLQNISWFCQVPFFETAIPHGMDIKSRLTIHDEL